MPSKAIETAVNGPSMLQVVLMGLITVFVVLVCLIAIIKVMGMIMAKAVKKPEASAAPASAPAPQAAGPSRQQLVAAISAAIAEDMGCEVGHLKIHSIRRL